ncbi:protein mono-ADP-ribosyltransferase PARP11 [Tribolium castaneum]|uniref:protein mono-ADP-ribosyltransferase PARP11 n=1 Tax=Tribolium castaneum TaxID=7070 RepID=UPI0030FF01B0
MKRAREDDEYDDFCNGLQFSDGNSASPSPRHRIKRPKVNPNYETIKFHFGASSVTYKTIQHTDPAFKKIKDLIDIKSLMIEDLIEVNNPVLDIAYEMKKCEKKHTFGNVNEALLFHGTRRENVESICTYNFDWRLFGSNRGHKFGKGVNFSPSAKYASNYSDPHSYHKIMIVAKVLIGNVCQGDQDMSLPPPGYDTSQKDQRASVIVKYEDNEFYPYYILHYHLREKHRNNNHYRYDCNYINRYDRYHVERRRYNTHYNYYRDRYGPGYGNYRYDNHRYDNYRYDDYRYHRNDHYGDRYDGAKTRHF